MLPTLVVILPLVLFQSMPSVVHSQIVADCDGVVASARDVARNSCGCQLEPKCNTCVDFGRFPFVMCANGCEFCNKDVCGTLQKKEMWPTVVNALFDPPLYQTTYNTAYTWNYTKGRSGSVIYRFSVGASVSNTCDVQVNGQDCTSCQLVTCSDGSVQPTIDCANLETGARATACSGRSSGGPVSLDESALAGLLAPLAYPYLLCLRGTVVLGNGTVVHPVNATTAPAPTPDNNNCGWFQLGIICLRGCGFLRRVLGLCKAVR